MKLLTLLWKELSSFRSVGYQARDLWWGGNKNKKLGVRWVSRADGCRKGGDAGKIHLAFLDQLLLESLRLSHLKISLVSEHTLLKAAGEPCAPWGLTLHWDPMALASIYSLTIKQRWLCPSSSPLPAPLAEMSVVPQGGGAYCHFSTPPTRLLGSFPPSAPC